MAMIVVSIPKVGAMSDANPESVGTVSAGVSDDASRADHVHDIGTVLNNNITLVDFNQTQTNHTFANADKVAVKTLAISNAEAEYDYIIAYADGLVSLTPDTTEPRATLAIGVGATDIADTITYNGRAEAVGGNVQYGYAIKRVLTAGTDYTKGTGFNLNLNATALHTTSSSTVYVNTIIAEGVK